MAQQGTSCNFNRLQEERESRRFKNGGAEYRPGKPRHVYDHDWLIKELGNVAPFGIYNLNNNVGYVNLGQSRDTAEFLPARASPNGGTLSAKRVSPAAKSSLSFVTAEAATGAEFVYGNGLSLVLPGTALKFMYPTCLPVRPNGTRWNIDCSATSRKIGPVSRWLILRPL